LSGAASRDAASVLDCLARLVRAVNFALATVSQILVSVLVAVVLTDVVMRYAFNAPTIWATDVARYLLLFIFFTALAPALQSGHHVAVDLFDKVLPRALLRHQAKIGGTLLIVFGLIFTWELWRTFVHTVEDGALANSLLVLPLKYFFWIGPLGALHFVLTAIALMSGRLPKPSRGVE